MSVNLQRWCFCLGYSLLLVSQRTCAFDWQETVITPFADPLLAAPDRLEHGKRLPDAQALNCESTAESLAPLLLPQAIHMALCQHPQLSSTWAGIKLKAAQLGEARASFLPTVTAGYSNMKQSLEYPNNNSIHPSSRTLESQYYSLTWRLIDFGKRAAQHLAATASLEAGLASHDAAIQKIILEVTTAYFKLQTARAERDAKELIRELAQQTLALTLKRETRGASAQTDVQQAKLSLAKAILEHTRASTESQKAYTGLYAAMGVSALPENGDIVTIPVDETAEPQSFEGDLTQWLQLAKQHPSIKAAQAQVTAAEAQLSSTLAEGLPTIDLSRSEYTNGRPNQGLPSVKTIETVTGVSLTIPLFEGFARTYKVRGAQAQIEIKQAELRDTHNMILAGIMRAYSDAQAAVRNLSATLQLVEAAQQSLLAVQRRYDRGLSDTSEMINAQNTLAEAYKERVKAQADWRSARLRLLANAGSANLGDIPLQ